MDNNSKPFYDFYFGFILRQLGGLERAGLTFNLVIPGQTVVGVMGMRMRRHIHVLQREQKVLARVIPQLLVQSKFGTNIGKTFRVLQHQ